MVAVFQIAGRKVVVPGDNESASLDDLMEGTNFRSAVEGADILLASHHGRESGYHTDFVKHVDPDLTVVSDGKYVDTSETPQYSRQSNGVQVERDDGTRTTRYVVTTRNDGVVSVNISTGGSVEVKLTATSQP
jgi:competence protein ComEC